MWRIKKKTKNRVSSPLTVTGNELVYLLSYFFLWVLICFDVIFIQLRVIQNNQF